MSTKILGIGAGSGAALMVVVMGVVTPQLQAFEGTRYQAYHDLGGVLTVCTGHTGPDVVVGKVYTPAQCATLTQEDAQKAANGVLKVSPHLIWHPMQLAAAVSFSYNVGVGTYEKSTVAELFNEGNFVGACNYLLKYDHIGTKVDAGLLDRRKKEQAICLSTLTAKGMANVATTSQSSN